MRSIGDPSNDIQAPSGVSRPQEPWSPSYNHAHKIDTDIDFEDDVVKSVSPELGSGWFC